MDGGLTPSGSELIEMVQFGDSVSIEKRAVLTVTNVNTTIYTPTVTAYKTGIYVNSDVGDTTTETYLSTYRADVEL